MIRIILVCLISSLHLASFAQSKQDYVWLFGQSSEASAFLGFKFDFNKPPMDVEVQDVYYGMGKANASICDKNGSLLFYMNGCAVMNKDFSMMTNGDSLGYNIWWDVFNKNCNRGIGSFQDHMILNDPGNADEYYILHKPKIFNGFDELDSIQFWYSKVDMSLDNEKGEVTTKNQVLDNSRIFLVSYLTAINHQNGKDWWVIQAPSNDSIFHTYKIDQDGIKLNIIQNSHHYFTRGKTSASGTAKFSPDGNKYAMYNETDGLLIYDFDRENGILEFNDRIITYDTIGSGIFCSLEWSPNSRYIYTATYTHLHQVDLWEEDIQQNGVRLIDIYNGTQDPFSTSFFLMAQAPDCKIYMTPTNGSNSYHVIHRPDELGTACNFVQNGIKLPSPSLSGMPNFPRFRVDEEEKCDPTLTSVFGDAVYYRRDLNVYPSPSDGRYTIEVPDGFRSGTLSVINLDGQVVESKEVGPSTLSVDVDITRYPSGYYHVELYPEENVERVFWSMQVIKK
jgi:hypothetical protein